MPVQPTLSADEWEIVLYLLEQEQANLPPEIRRTDNREMHEQLQGRLQVVTSLIDRIRPATAQAEASLI